MLRAAGAWALSLRTGALRRVNPLKISPLTMKAGQNAPISAHAISLQSAELAPAQTVLDWSRNTMP